jgi:hypothetical protein
MAGRVVEVGGGGAAPGGDPFPGIVVAVDRPGGLVVVVDPSARPGTDVGGGGAAGRVGWAAPGSPTALAVAPVASGTPAAGGLAG